jgi:ADP-ribose pyrophosphatase
MIRKDKLEELKSIVEELKTIQVEKKEVSEDNKFLKSFAYNFKLNNGRTLSREKLIKGNNDGSAVIIIPCLANEEILMVIEPRVFTELTVGIGFPAGYIENDEDVFSGALRELREETGYVPEEIILIDSFYQDEGCSSALNRIFLALNCEKRFSQNLDSDEVVKYMSFNYEELFELEELGYIRGGNSKLALEKSKKYVRKR